MLSNDEREAEIRLEMDNLRSAPHPREISHLSLYRYLMFFRERLDEARAEVARLMPLAYSEGHGKPCYYCGQPISALAGNPGLWPVALTHSDDPGVAKWHHARCVEARLTPPPAASAMKLAERLVYDHADIFHPHQLEAIELIASIMEAAERRGAERTQENPDG
jgi:hypothetical protein